MAVSKYFIHLFPFHTIYAGCVYNLAVLLGMLSSSVFCTDN